MGKIKVTKCDIEGLYVIEPTVFKDERGYFVETYNYNDFKEAGLDMQFVHLLKHTSIKSLSIVFVKKQIKTICVVIFGHLFKIGGTTCLL